MSIGCMFAYICPTFGMFKKLRLQTNVEDLEHFYSKTKLRTLVLPINTMQCFIYFVLGESSQGSEMAKATERYVP